MHRAGHLYYPLPPDNGTDVAASASAFLCEAEAALRPDNFGRLRELLVALDAQQNRAALRAARALLTDHAALLGAFEQITSTRPRTALTLLRAPRADAALLDGDGDAAAADDGELELRQQPTLIVLQPSGRSLAHAPIQWVRARIDAAPPSASAAASSSSSSAAAASASSSASTVGDGGDGGDAPAWCGVAGEVCVPVNRGLAAFEYLDVRGAGARSAQFGAILRNCCGTPRKSAQFSPTPSLPPGHSQRADGPSYSSCSTRKETFAPTCRRCGRTRSAWIGLRKWRRAARARTPMAGAAGAAGASPLAVKVAAAARAGGGPTSGGGGGGGASAPLAVAAGASSLAAPRPKHARFAPTPAAARDARASAAGSHSLTSLALPTVRSRRPPPVRLRRRRRRRRRGRWQWRRRRCGRPA